MKLESVFDIKSLDIHNTTSFQRKRDKNYFFRKINQ